MFLMIPVITIVRARGALLLSAFVSKVASPWALVQCSDSSEPPFTYSYNSWWVLCPKFSLMISQMACLTRGTVSACSSSWNQTVSLMDPMSVTTSKAKIIAGVWRVRRDNAAELPTLQLSSSRKWVRIVSNCYNSSPAAYHYQDNFGSWE